VNKLNILFTICGRAGSKGLKNKNIQYFLGYPLVGYTLAVISLYIEKYCKQQSIDVCLNTDSVELTKLVKMQSDVHVMYLKRDLSLSEDNTPKLAVIKDCLSRCEQTTGKNYDIIVDLDITSPLRTLADVENAINLKIEKTYTDVVFSVTNSRRSPYFNMVYKKGDSFCQAIPTDFTARQQVPETYDMNASIYAYERSFLVTNTTNRLFDGCCWAFSMMDTAVLDIDCEEDFELMQVIAEFFYVRRPEMKLIRNRVSKQYH